MRLLRKRTVFLPCSRHAAMYASETRYRRAEVMVEGGWANSPCADGERCQMRPGTDFYTAEFVAANPTYTAEQPSLTPTEARDAVLAGRTVRLTVGTAPDDPILRVWREDGCIMSESVAGWSAGVVEPVCDVASDFLTTYYLLNRHRLEIA